MLEMMNTAIEWVQSQYLIWTLIKILAITIPSRLPMYSSCC